MDKKIKIGKRVYEDTLFIKKATHEDISDKIPKIPRGLELVSHSESEDGPWDGLQRCLYSIPINDQSEVERWFT